MATLTGFTRLADPIEADGLSKKISNDIGITVSAEMMGDFTVQVTGSVTESNRTAIQASINSYIYPSFGIRQVTSNTTVLSTDKILNVDTTSGDVTITLFNAQGNNTRRIEIKKISTNGNMLMLQPVSGQTIDGKSQYATTSTTMPNYIIESDGNNLWFK